jgi:large conductance mechanosensitive channel
MNTRERQGTSSTPRSQVPNSSEKEKAVSAFGKLAHVNPAKGALTLIDEFKRFAFKGNVIDLAIGVIIGAAFGKIVDSLVKHIIMPAVSLILPGEQGYLGWKLVFNAKEIPYGLFIGEVVNFLLVAAALFLFVVKFLGWVMRSRKQEEVVAGPPPLTKDQELLTEIRDLLNKRAA